MSQFDLDFRGQFFHERSDARRDFRNAITAALRQRADEATKAENEAIAEYFQQFGKWYSGPEIAAAIRARIASKGEP